MHTLTEREREILDLLAQGFTGAAATEQLFLSPDTVRTHVRNAMEKLQARTRVQAVVLAMNQRAIEVDPAKASSNLEREAAPPRKAPVRTGLSRL